MNQLLPFNTTATTAISSLKKPVVAISESDKNKLKLAVDTWAHTAKTNKIKKPVYQIAERDKLLIEWLWNTGMRISDALSIKYRDIDMQKETVTYLVKKRSKTKPYIHTVSLDKSILFEVQRYKEALMIKPEERLFGIARQTFDSNLAVYCQLAGLPKYSAHKFRHGCAMDLLRKGILPHVIAYRLAHTSTMVTESTYARMDHEIERKMLAELRR